MTEFISTDKLNKWLCLAAFLKTAVLAVAFIMSSFMTGIIFSAIDGIGYFVQTYICTWSFLGPFVLLFISAMKSPNDKLKSCILKTLFADLIIVILAFIVVFVYALSLYMPAGDAALRALRNMLGLMVLAMLMESILFGIVIKLKEVKR